MIIFGVILYLADRLNSNTRTEPNNYPKDAIVLGLWQSIALIPGTSRSGVTITAARILGYERKNAARIAMLMSIPTILASGTVEIADIWYQANLAHLSDAVVVSLLSFIFAFFALAVMMKLLKSINFTPYVIYRVALGILLLFIAYT
jgi:undecaprenyl-diphosphatase